MTQPADRFYRQPDPRPAYVPTDHAREHTRITDADPIREWALNAAIDLATVVPPNTVHYAVEDAVRALLTLSRVAESVRRTEDAATQLGTSGAADTVAAARDLVAHYREGHAPAADTLAGIMALLDPDPWRRLPEPAAGSAAVLAALDRRRAERADLEADALRRCTGARSVTVTHETRHADGTLTTDAAATSTGRAPGTCHCGAPSTPNDYPDVCDSWPLCEERPTAEPGPAPDPETGRPGYVDGAWYADDLPDGRWTALPRLDPRKARDTFDLDRATGHPSRGAATDYAGRLLETWPDLAYVDLLDFGRFVTTIYREGDAPR